MPRKVDQLVVKNSLADKLRRRRDEIESGDPTGGSAPEMKSSMGEADENSPSNVINRGYFIAKDDT